MERSVVNILSSCRGPRSKPRHRSRFLKSDYTTSSSTASLVPSFSLGMEFDASQDGVVSLSSRVTKRARLGKRVSGNDPVEICNKRCSSLDEIYESLETPSLITVPESCDTGSRLILESKDVYSYVEEPGSSCVMCDDSNSLDVGLGVDSIMTDVVITEISNEDAVGFPETDLSIIDKGVTMSEVVVSRSDAVPDHGFAQFDEGEFDREMRSRDKTGTTKSNEWVRNRFNQWRIASNIDTSIALEDIPLRDLADLLCKFFYVLMKKNGKHYPSQSVMQIYKGFNRIFCQVQKDRIDSTGINEEPFCMHSHPYFGRVNKSVILAMRKSIMAGANKARRKVDFFTEEEELKILAHPLQQANCASGVQKRFALFCTTVFLIRGNNELYNCRLADFTLGTDERGREMLRYDEATSKNHKPTLSKYQPEHFRDPVYSHDSDVINTFKVLVSHMPKVSSSGHLFLSPIHHPKDHIWFKASVNLGESTLRHFLRDMAAAIGLQGDYTNKSGRVTTITRMCAGGVPLDAIASNTGHANYKSIERYDRSKVMRVRAAQTLARPGGSAKDYEEQFQIEMTDWHTANGARKESTVVFNEITNNGGVELTRYQVNSSVPASSVPVNSSVPTSSVPASTVPASCPRPTSIVPASSMFPASTVPVSCAMPASTVPGSSVQVSCSTRPSFRASDVAVEDIVGLNCTPASTQPSNIPIPATSTCSAALVEEEMRFWSQYDFDAEGDDCNQLPSKVAEAPKGTRFAMQKNVALLRRENGILKPQLAKIIKQQASLLNQLEQQASLLNQLPRAAQNPRHQFRPSSSRIRYPYPPQGFASSRPDFVDNQQPGFVDNRQPGFVDNRQSAFKNFQTALPFPFSLPHVAQGPQNLNCYDVAGGYAMPWRPVDNGASISPIYGNTVYNYQSFDVGHMLGGSH